MSCASLYLRNALPALVLFWASCLSAQDDYPPGTYQLAPVVDLGLQPVLVDVPAQFKDLVPDNYTLNLPPGFSASVFAVQGLSRPRFLAFSPEGVLHVANMGLGQVVAYPDRNLDGVADEGIVVLSGLIEGHSLAFYKDALYVTEEHRVSRVFDRDGDGIYADDHEAFIVDIPREGGHDTRTIVFDELNEKLYLSVGSPCDLCRQEPGLQLNYQSEPAVPYSPERGSILQFNADGSGRRIFATGVRNVIGMDMHPVTNELWGNNNHFDFAGPDLPPEWIDIIRDNGFYGLPFAYGYQAYIDFSIPQYQLLLPLSRQDSLLVESMERPVALVEAHLAPMGIHFYRYDSFPVQYRNAAFVALRGGQVRGNLAMVPGFKVIALFSEPDGSNARVGDFLTGFGPPHTDGGVIGKPVGLTTDVQGRLYVTSDTQSYVVLRIDHSKVSGVWEGALPEDLAVGEVLDLGAQVRLERTDEAGGPVRVTADLSAFGGEAAVPLVAVDDNIYQLDLALPVDSPLGPRTISVLFEQEADGAVHRMLLPHTFSVLPALSATWEHDLPDSLFAGSAFSAQALIRLERLAPNRAPPRVSADLSEFGGPTDVLLEAVDEHTYRLERRFELDPATGNRTLVIRVEQDPQDTAYQLEFSKTIAVLPGRDELIAGDEAGTGWAVETRNGAAPPQLSADGPVFLGKEASAVKVEWTQFKPNWEMDFVPPRPIEPFGYKSLRFAFYPGELDGPSFALLALTIDDYSVDLLGGDPAYRIDLARREWQVVEIPISEFSIDFVAYPIKWETAVEAIDFIRFNGNLSGEFYLDDVRLISAAKAPIIADTAVLEERDQAQADEFSLGQNYPNPFNSATSIRFSLADAKQVELAVFNLAGQKLATLVKGQRSAGAYSVHWDGRDEGGRQLASGVYLYRLQAGDWVEIRKLSLLR